PNHIADRVDEEFQRTMRPFQAYKWSDAKEIQRAGMGPSHVVQKDAFWTQAALDFIEEYFNSASYDREQTQPVLLKVSLLQPHYPYLTDAQKFGYYLNRVSPFLDQ